MTIFDHIRHTGRKNGDPETPLTSPPNPSDGLGLDAVKPARLDSPWRTMVGLAVLWGSLMLIFAANRWSESYLRLEPPHTRSAGQDPGLLALEPRVQLLLPFSIHLRDTSPRQALARIARDLEFGVTRDALGLVSDEPRNIKYSERPLCQVLHDLLALPGQPALGFALRERQLLIFKLPAAGTDSPGQPLDLEWAAELPLSRDRLVVAPAGRANLLLTLSLAGEISQPEAQWHIVRLEVWQGRERLLDAPITLDAAGAGQLGVTKGKAGIRLSIKRQREARGEMPAQYQIRFFFQAAT